VVRVVALLPFAFSEIPSPPLFAGEGPLLPYNLRTFTNRAFNPMFLLGYRVPSLRSRFHKSAFPHQPTHRS
jgi:hypothetical protein